MATMDPCIRIASARETHIILQLVEELLAELESEGEEYTAIDRDRLRQQLERETSAGGQRFLALLAIGASGIAVGVLTLSISFAIYAGGEYGVIDEMYVRPEHRSRGIGTGLVAAAVAIARDRGWFRLDVTAPESEAPWRTVQDSVPPGGTAVTATAGRAARAIRFYEQLGFEHTGPKLRLII